MKILLDECLPVDFRHHFPGHEVHTAEWAGFKSLKNWTLLDGAEAAGYDVFLTVDRGGSAPTKCEIQPGKVAFLP